MTTHSSAPTREETLHTNQTTRTATIIDALTRRAQAVLNDKSIDPQSRAILRYALQINDPWLAKLVQQSEADDKSSVSKIDILVDLICRPGDEPETRSSALFVLMSMLERSAEPKSLANTAKNLAFSRCGELTFNDMVDAQIAVYEGKLFGD